MNLLVRTCNYGRMNIQRVIARAVVAAGILVTGAAVVGAFAEIGYTARTPLEYAEQAAVPLAIAIVVFLVGLWFEVLAALILMVGAVAMIVWGFLAGWDAALWGAMVVFVIGPMIVSGMLYLMASQEQKVCDLEEKVAK
ncbi:MAG: hypothetical protein Q7W16_05865 [Coriobacteriia bacterium]|nr:hypothetical protein [Coriobacteriia bacterium]